MIAYIDYPDKTVHTIGIGSQIYRACQLVFTKNAIYWGTDTGVSGNIPGIYRYDRDTRKIIKIADVSGCVFYGTILRDGTIIMSIDREGALNEEDIKTRLLIFFDDKNVATVPSGTWANRKKYAKIRFQRDQGAFSLYMTCLNLKEINDGDLIIISEDDIRSVMRLNKRPSE